MGKRIRNTSYRQKQKLAKHILRLHNEERKRAAAAADKKKTNGAIAIVAVLTITFIAFLTFGVR